MATTIEAIASPTRLDYLPIGLFGANMGLTGLSVAWKLAHTLFGMPLWISELIAATSVLTFLVLLIAYGIKLFGAPEKVVLEFRHPIAGNLFGTLLMSLLLLPILIAPLSLVTARILWFLGAVGMVLFAWLIVSRWMSDRQQTAHATPRLDCPGSRDAGCAASAAITGIATHAGGDDSQCRSRTIFRDSPIHTDLLAAYF